MTPINPGKKAVAHGAAAKRSRSRRVAGEIPATPDARAEDQLVVHRIDQLPRDVGWLLVYVGVLGVILPGIVGFPFVIAGGAVLLPGGPRLLKRWVGRNPPPFVHACLKQIGRLLEDVERRYPRLPRTPS
jgi:hypothetical protein